MYALIVNPILSSVLLFVLSYRAYPQRLRPTFGLDAIRKIFSFSAYQFLFNAINYFSRNLDKLLIGKYMGMTPLGYYEKSYRLMMLPLQNITHVISPVMHPVFSEFQHDLQRVRTSYEKIVRLLAFIGFPLSVFLWFAAQEVVLIIFGSQWMPSVPVFRILSLSCWRRPAGFSRRLTIRGAFLSAGRFRRRSTWLAFWSGFSFFDRWRRSHGAFA